MTLEINIYMVKDINPGMVFRHKNQYFLRTEWTDVHPCKPIAVHLNTGELWSPEKFGDDIVELVRAKMVLGGLV